MFLSFFIIPYVPVPLHKFLFRWIWGTVGNPVCQPIWNSFWAKLLQKMLEVSGSSGNQPTLVVDVIVVLWSNVSFLLGTLDEELSCHLQGESLAWFPISFLHGVWLMSVVRDATFDRQHQTLENLAFFCMIFERLVQMKQVMDSFLFSRLCAKCIRSLE